MSGTESDLQYYKRRAGEEWRAAASAACPEARACHRTMAEHYARLAESEAGRAPVDEGV